MRCGWPTGRRGLADLGTGTKATESPLTERQRYELIATALRNERASFEAHWRDLNDYILPRRYRAFTSDTNRGDRRNQKILDPTATLAARTLRAGMMGGVTSPARPWFRLTTPDPDLAEFGAVKSWLDDTTRRMQTVFLRSNVYNALPILYGDVGVFATAAMAVEEDPRDVIRCFPFPPGSYWIGVDETLRVDTFYREWRMSVRQLVGKYGYENVSDHVKRRWTEGQREDWIDVCYLIYPNPVPKAQPLYAYDKRWQAVTYEKGTGYATGSASTLTVLRRSGFDQFPILAPRWEVTGEDAYGTDCPGMTTLGFVKGLQTLQKRKLQAIEKMVNPPMVGPTALKRAKASTLPGDITFTDEREGTKGFRPAHEVQMPLAELKEQIFEDQQITRRGFFEDLFLMLAQSDRREITAREIEERHEEKLLAVGPVLEQLNQDLLDPLIDLTFAIMVKQGLIAPPPPELEGMDLKVEYISVMAQAQKLVGVSSIERFMGGVSNLAKMTGDPTIVRYKINTDNLIDDYGDRLSIRPDIIRTDEEAAALRQQDQEAQQALARSEAIERAAGSAQKLAGASLEEDNALNRILSQAKAGSLVPT